MKDVIYHTMAAVEDTHWWFAGRRRIARDILERLPVAEGAAILEVGCGTGGNFGLLREFGQVFATDSDERALDYSRRQDAVVVQPGALPRDLPYGDRTFDLVALFDVLEHVDEDQESLDYLFGRVAEGGRLVLTVPAFGFLWSAHDDHHHHKRRYTRGELARKTRAAGFRIRKLSYYNTWLFPLVAVVRLLERVGPDRAVRDLSVPPAPVNRLLTAIFASERFFLRFFSFPFGVSLVLVAERDG